MAQDDPFGWRSSIVSRPIHSAAALSQAGSLDAQTVFVGQRYDKIAIIGQGGMGQVWLGWDNVIKRNVAIKIPLGDHDSTHAKRLMREVLLMARLEHPGIVAVHDVYEDEDRPLFVMSLVRGETMSQLLDTTPMLAPNVLLTHLLQACDAVGFAHKHGIVHRDITPRNMIIAQDGNAKVIDWGLAVALEDAMNDRALVGTPGYMSPEQQEGLAVTPCSDVWSLGRILMDILESADVEDAALIAVAERAMALDPTARYGDARQFGDELRRWFEGRRIEAYDVTLWRQTRRFVALYRRVILAACVVVSLIIGSLTWGVVRSNEEAARAKLATRDAQRATKEAQAANARAQKTFGVMHMRAARQALKRGDYREARKEAEESLKRLRTPEVYGLWSNIAMTPQSDLKRSWRYGSCVNMRMLTDVPDQWICQERNGWVSMYHGDRKVWRQQVESLSELRIHQQKIYAKSGEYMEVRDLQTGALIEQDRRVARFSSSVGGMRVNEVGDQLLLEKQRSVFVGYCGDDNLHYVFESGQDYILLCETRALRLRLGEVNVLKTPLTDKLQEVVRDHRGINWVVDITGKIARVGSYVVHDFGQTVRSIEHIPNTSYLLVNGRKGRTRVFDTSQREWVSELPSGAQEARALRDGTILMLWSNGRVEQWSVDVNATIWRYKRQGNGFANVAWSLNGERLAGIDGAGYVHVIEPQKGVVYEPFAAGERVGKWVAIAPHEPDRFYSVGMDVEAVMELSVDGEHVVGMPFLYRPEGARRVVIFRNQYVGLSNIGYRLIGVSHGVSQPVSYYEPKSQFLGAIDLSIDPQFEIAVLTAKDGIWLWRAPYEPVRFASEVQPTRVFASALDHAGRLATINRSMLWVFRSDGALINKWAMPSRPVDVAWRPGYDQLVTAHINGEVIVWGMNGEVLLRTTPHINRIGTIDVSRDGKFVASAGWDGLIYVMDLTVLERL